MSYSSLFSNQYVISKPINFQSMPYPNMGPSNMIQSPNCHPQLTFAYNTTPQDNTNDSDKMGS